MSKFSHNFKSAGSNLNFLTWFGKSVFVSLEKKEEEERERRERDGHCARKGKGQREKSEQKRVREERLPSKKEQDVASFTIESSAGTPHGKHSEKFFVF